MSQEDTHILLKKVQESSFNGPVELNLSCPNVPGKPQIAYDLETTEKLLSEIFKYFTIQAVDCCLVCGEFVKRNWHGESPCAEGQSASRYMG